MDCKENKEELQEKTQNRIKNMLKVNLQSEIRMQFLSNKIYNRKLKS